MAMRCLFYNFSGLFLGFLVFLSCEKKEIQKMRVSGKIKGLRKGTLYLQTFQNEKDTVMSVVDSMVLKGKEHYTLQTFVKSPKIYKLSLGKNTEKNIVFFGENIPVFIDADLRFFATKNKIKAGKLQEDLENYNEIIKKMNFRRLQNIKKSIEAQKNKKFKKADSLKNLINGYHKRTFLYTLNFAITHPDTEITPYLVLKNLQNLSIKYLDSIQNNLKPKIQKSFYGKALKNFIEKRKNENNK